MPQRLSRKELKYMMDFEGDPYIDGYRRGFRDGRDTFRSYSVKEDPELLAMYGPDDGDSVRSRRRPKRKLSAWNKYIKNKRNHIKYRDGKLNLKKMAVAFRRKKRR